MRQSTKIAVRITIPGEERAMKTHSVLRRFAVCLTVALAAVTMSDVGAQTKGLVSPQVLLTLRSLNSNSVPGPPASGMKLFMKADMRRVLIPVAGIGRTFPETFQAGSCQTLSSKAAASNHGR